MTKRFIGPPNKRGIKGGSLFLTKEQARGYSLRAAKVNKENNKWQIEGRTWTSEELAKELGVGQGTVQAKLRAAQKLDGPVTMERLRTVPYSTKFRKKTDG